MKLDIDFPKNYAIQHMIKQSAYQKQAQITLHTLVAWFRSDIFLHVIISDNLKHDKYVVVVQLSRTLKYQPENVCFLEAQNGGPNSPFKNKSVMGAIEMLSEMYNIKIIQNFITTSYAKGAIDGVGATLEVENSRVRSIFT